ncbi:MAG: ATP-binding cassette domain-containing protein [Prevotellaceae bacterium]|jgi:molybdate transport system ATP-binding protein|nr:ATP-binding cassette domain-containing protein [Prevotellaceae bacterium]
MIIVENAILRHPEFQFAEPVSFTIERGEHLVFIGPNGGGKSLLAQMITGRYPLKSGKISYEFSSSYVYENIKFIAFRDTYGTADSSYYLQQRWNSQDREESPLVSEIFACISGDSLSAKLYRLFDMDAMLGKQLVLLSSGEMRKFQLTKALLKHPRILMIDNPFIGLDHSSRRQVSDLLDELSRTGEVQIIMLLSKAEEIPDFITHVISVDGMRCRGKTARKDFRPPLIQMPLIEELSPPVDTFSSDFCVQDKTLSDKKKSDTVIDLHEVSIRYGSRTILDSLSWTVKRGEKWALLGANGSGKSTLLSLVCADNPQAYSCDISLFGFRRGSGESIWEIKKRIGYVSPEMHRAYSENLPAIEIVASGLYDTVGLYRRPRSEQFSVCEWWMKILEISDLRNRSFLQLSDGEQRMVLLARAFVKDPELLILDEPMHGLDSYNRLLVKSLIEAFCRRPEKTLIMVTHYQEDLPKCITQTLTLQ